jgi:hypothetical protein
MSDTASVVSASTALTAATGAGDGGGGAVTILPHLTREWVRLEDEVRTLSAEIKARRRRIKETRSMILQIMRTNALARLGISTGHVVREEKISKAAVSKKYLNMTLIEFFEGDITRARACAEWIESHRPTKTMENLTIQPKDTN